MRARLTIVASMLLTIVLPSAAQDAKPAGNLKLDIFGGIITKETKLDKWARGTIKTISDNKITVENGSFEPGALKGRVINPNFERAMEGDKIDPDTAKKYPDAPQYCTRYYKIIDNTADTITTDPADGKLTEYARAGDKYLLCGFFTVGKLNDRFVMFTPLGHPYMGFGPDSTYPRMWGYLDGKEYADYPKGKPLADDKDVWKVKYGSNRAKWYDNFMKNMAKVGFNMSAGYFSDVPLFGPSKTGDTFLKPELPFIAWYHALEMGMRDKKAKNGLFDSPIKDILDGCENGRDFIHGRQQGDVFDPQFEKACEIMSKYSADRIKNNPWFIGYILEETDFLFAFARGHDQFLLGWGVMVSMPHHGQSNRGETGLPKFTDTKQYTKFAMRDWLKAKYGTIEQLNAAWGSDYTTWDESKEGYGKGKGLIDEDGKLGAKWLGAWHTAKGANPNCYKDMNDFIPVYVERLHKIESEYLRKADPNHLIIGCKVPGYMDEYQAMAKYVDMLRGLPPKGATGDLVKPGLMAVYLSADEDSACHIWYDGTAAKKGGYRDPKGIIKTQPEKAKAYRQRLQEAWNYTPDGKTYPLVMVSYWGWGEQANEYRNWGLVSFKDNLYDGKEATKLGADGKAGTADDEDRDYGDCVTGFKAAHDELLSKLKDFVENRRKATATQPSSKDPLNWVPEDQY